MGKTERAGMPGGPGIPPWEVKRMKATRAAARQMAATEDVQVRVVRLEQKLDELIRLLTVVPDKPAVKPRRAAGGAEQ